MTVVVVFCSALGVGLGIAGLVQALSGAATPPRRAARLHRRLAPAAGRAADRSGPALPYIAGLIIFASGLLVSGLATSMPMLVGGRALQGIGAGGCAVLPFAMVQDLYQGDDARTKRSYITVVLGAAPVLAPAVGSVLSEFGGWRAVYVVLAIGGSLLLLTAPFAIPESKRSTPVTTDRATTSRLRNDTAFIGLAISNALSYGAIFSYIAGAPIVIIGIMKLSPAVFSGIFASTALALTAGAWTSGRLGRYGFGATALLNPSLAIAVLVASVEMARQLGISGEPPIQIGLVVAATAMTYCGLFLYARHRRQQVA